MEVEAPLIVIICTGCHFLWAFVLKRNLTFNEEKCNVLKVIIEGKLSFPSLILYGQLLASRMFLNSITN